LAIDKNILKVYNTELKLYLNLSRNNYFFILKRGGLVMSGIHLGPDGKPYQSWQEAEEARIRYFEPESIANRKIWALEAEKEKLKTELEAAQNRVRLLEECIEKFKERIETDLKAAKVMSSLNSVDRKKYYLEAKKFIQELLDKINRIEKDVLKKKG